MAEWPKSFGADSDGNTVAIGPEGLTKVPAGVPLIPADLGRELWVALKEADEDIQEFADKDVRLQARDALERYEREVGNA